MGQSKRPYVVTLCRCSATHVTGGKMKISARLARAAGIAPGDGVIVAWVENGHGRPRLVAARKETLSKLDDRGCLPPGRRWLTRAWRVAAGSSSVAIYVPGFPTGTRFSQVLIPLTIRQGIIYMTPLDAAPAGGAAPAAARA